ncbi:MAG: O-antigen ligase family protein [Candidatus Coatesbacteria bacterium]|nr:MAG: O-antigen ligase family protein [Candidatus Coatesbacteria bacterium]
MTKTLILIVAVVATLALAWVYVNFGLKFLAPGVLVLGVLALMLFFRDVKTPFFYLLIILLPVFIARYLAPLPDVEHPGLLNVPVLYPYEIPLYVFIFLWFIEFLSGRGKGLYVPRATLGLALLFVPAVLSMFTALDWTYGAFELVRMFEMFLFFLLIVNYLKTDRQLKIVILILGLSIAFQSVLSFMQYINPWGVYEVLATFGIYMGISHATPYDPASPIRACGTTGYCNFLAGFFELTVPLFLGLYFFYPLSKTWKRLIVGVLALALIALLLTFSRGGLLAVGVGALALIVLGVRRFPQMSRHVLRVSLAVAVQLAVIFALLSEKLFMRLRFFTETMEDEVRLALMVNAVEMIRDNPLFGVGLNNYPEAFYAYEVTGVEFEMLFPVHNTWLLIASEQGLLGLAAFLIFMGYIVWDARRGTWEKSSLHAVTAVGLTAGLIGWFTHNLVAPLYQTSLVNRTTFIFVVAILAVLPRLRPEEEPPPL